ncbi:MAG: MliC family protein [Methylococcales bacterium]|nr:MliC family protein [Methylococcales bacterium]
MKFQKLSKITVCFVFIFMLSCTYSKANSEQDNKHILQTYVYECQGGYNFTARVENKGIWLFLPGQTIKLPQVQSGSGAKYSEGNKLFWSKGDEALLEIDSEKYKGCINNQAKAIWEDAKLNGWDFRAVGNEPGWHVLISKDKGITLVSNYGRTIHKFTTPEPLTNQINRTTKYHARENGHILELILKGSRCLDTMSDEPFETTVTVILDGKKFNGCGRALH